MNRMPIERAKQEIDGGIALTGAALGDPTKLAPFFRVPGLARAEGIEDYLAAKGLQVWSADFPADDWRHVSSSRVYELAMKRLEDKGKGVLLLHDIQARTVAALPKILHELKVRGYRIVHVVAATPQNPATPTEAWEWQLHPPSEAVATSHWPKIPNFVFGGDVTLPAPSLSDMDWRDGQSMALAESEHARRPGRGVPLPREAPWPRQSPLLQDSAAIALPIPAQSVFEVQEGLRAAIRAATPSARHAERSGPARLEANSVDAGGSRRAVRGRPHREHTRQAAGHEARHAAHARRGTLKQSVLVRKRSA
jgi:hypothetical protein